MRKRCTLACVPPFFRIRMRHDAESISQKKAAEGIRVSRQIVKGKQSASRSLVRRDSLCQHKTEKKKYGQEKGAGVDKLCLGNDSRRNASCAGGCGTGNDSLRDAGTEKNASRGYCLIPNAYGKSDSTKQRQPFRKIPFHVEFFQSIQYNHASLGAPAHLGNTNFLIVSDERHPKVPSSGRLQE